MCQDNVHNMLGLDDALQLHCLAEAVFVEKLQFIFDCARSQKRHRILDLQQ